MDELKEVLEILWSNYKLAQMFFLVARNSSSKGKFSLKDAKLVNGAKLMMMATQGAHQGAAPIVKKVSAPLKTTLNKPLVVQEKLKLPAKSRLEAWRSTGIISLADSRVEEIAADIWTLGPAARVLELSSTMLKTLPSEISKLSNLQRLNLKGNNLENGSVSWKDLSSLKHLQVLVLDDNRFTRFPPEIQELSSLKQLLVSKNKLVSLPVEIGELSSLEKLDLSNNRLQQIPSSLGKCCSLLELDISKNYLTELPASIGDLRKLKVLNLDNNSLKDFPASVLKGCVKLNSLSLHSNQVTMEALREVLKPVDKQVFLNLFEKQTSGWKEFDARRKSKYDKQIDFHVLGSSDGFDEGADPERNRHW